MGCLFQPSALFQRLDPLPPPPGSTSEAPGPDKDKGITSAPCDNLYIANLPKHFRETDLHAIFAPFGTARGPRGGGRGPRGRISSGV